MSARARAVLDRFPLHVAAADPEKRFSEVVGGLTDALEVLTRQVGEVRRAHRLSEAPTVGDLRSLAGLHGLGDHVWDPLEVRLAGLSDAVGAEAPDAELLARLLGVPEELLSSLDAGDDEPLGDLAGRPARHRPSLELRRDVVRAAVGAHVVGNATATSLLQAAAAYLGFDVDELNHTEDRWWHVATCRDRIRLVTADGESVAPLPDLVALEENPFRAADIKPTPKKHGQVFRVIRGGIDDILVTVRVVGVGPRTVRPMVVECHAGRGLVFEGSVAEGSELQFEASGRATLDGEDVTGSAWSFHGAVFSSATDPVSSRDFVFAGDPADGDRQARFAVTAPLADAFGGAAFPHGAPTVAALGLPRGVSTWAVFVRVAHTSGPAGAPPRTELGRFDAQVFAEAVGPAGVTAGPAALELGFAWEEREAFAVRVLLPRRLDVLDDERGTRLRQPLRRLLGRHRAAGVDLRVEYADPRWTLGAGVVREEPDDAIGTVLSGTELWTDGTPQPEAG